MNGNLGWVIANYRALESLVLCLHVGLSVLRTLRKKLSAADAD